MPEIEILDVNWSPSEPQSGESIEFEVEVKNTTASTIESVGVLVYVDDEISHVPPNFDLEPGEQRWTVKTGSNSFDPGGYDAKAVIDHVGDSLDEYDEYEFSITVGSDLGWVEGTVSSSTGESIDGYRVDLRGDNISTRQDAVDNGRFDFDDVPPGDYQLRGYMVGYEGFEEDITVRENSGTTVDKTVSPEPHELTVDITGGGGVGINPPGVSTSDEWVEEYDPGTEITLSANPHSGYEFVEWEGDVSQTDANSEEITFELDDDKEIIGIFEEEGPSEYTLTVNVGSGGGVGVNPPGVSVPDEWVEEYDSGTEVTVTANPNSGYEFVEWEGDVSHTDADSEELTVVVDDDKEIYAIFEEEAPTEHTLTVSAGSGGGVEIDPPGVSTPGEWVEEYDPGTEVTVTAYPNSGYEFVEWEGDVSHTDANSEEITVVVDEDKEITGTFEEETPTEHTLTVNVDSGGSVGVNPPGVSVPDEWVEEYDPGTEITLFANPESGYEFVEWEGNVSDSDPNNEEITFELDEDREIIGTFEEEDQTEYTLIVDADSGGGIEIDPPGVSTFEEWNEEYDPETEVTVAANPDSGYEFVEWEGDVSDSDATSEEITVEVDEDKEISGIFEEEDPTEYTLAVNVGSGGDVTIDPPGESVPDEWVEEYDSGTEVTITANPDSGYEFVEWEGDIPSVESTDESVTVLIDSEKQLTVEFEEKEEIDAHIEWVRVDTGAYADGEKVNLSVEVYNSGPKEHEFFVDFDVIDENGNTYNNEGESGRSVLIGPGDVTTVDLEWDVKSDAPTGGYDAEFKIWKENDREDLQTQLDEEHKDGKFEVIREDTDYTIAAQDFDGNPVSDAIVKLTPSDGGSTLEEQVGEEDVTFEELAEHKYDYEVASSNQNQSIDGVLYPQDPFKEYTAHFPPVGHPHGVVLDDENGFTFPHAEIEIPELGLQTQSNKAGYFNFEENLPEGEYDIRVALPDGGAVETSTELGPSYAVTLEAEMDPLESDESIDDDRSLRDLFEPDILTRLLLETEALREKVRNAGRAIATSVHGIVRGVAAALYDVFDGFRELLSTIRENIGIPELGSIIADLYDIVTNVPTVITALSQSLIAGVENFVENASERQHDVNPHSDYMEDTANPSLSDPEYIWYRSFSGGWNLGYFGFKLAELLAVIGVIRRAGKSILTSGPQLVREALDTIESTATSLSTGSMKGMVSPVGRSGRSTDRSDDSIDSETFDNVLASGLGVATVASANIIKQVRTGIGEIRHRPNDAIRDEIEDVIENIGASGRDPGEMKGKLNEWASIGYWVNNENAFRALPSIRSAHVAGRFDIRDYNHGDWVLVPKVEPDFDGELDGVLLQVIKNEGEATVANVRIIEFKKGTDTYVRNEREQKFSTVEEIQELAGDREIADTGLQARHFDEVEQKDVYLIGNRKHSNKIRDNPEQTPTTADRRWDGYADYASSEIDEYYDALVGLDAEQRRIEFSMGER